jgi:chromatin remodeling complex protein RSC6
LCILSLSRRQGGMDKKPNVITRLEDSSMAAKKGKKAAKKPAAKKSTARKTVKRAAPKKAAKAKSKRKPNAAFMKPMTPSSTLAAVVGSSPMPRTEVTSKLWGYIKKNNLQDKTNRRMINADEKLRDVFGGKKQVSMFEMTKLVAKHLK